MSQGRNLNSIKRKETGGRFLEGIGNYMAMAFVRWFELRRKWYADAVVVVIASAGI